MTRSKLETRVREISDFFDRPGEGRDKIREFLNQTLIERHGPVIDQGEGSRILQHAFRAVAQQENGARLEGEVLDQALDAAVRQTVSELTPTRLLNALKKPAVETRVNEWRELIRGDRKLSELAGMFYEKIRSARAPLTQAREQLKWRGTTFQFERVPMNKIDVNSAMLDQMLNGMLTDLARKEKAEAPLNKESLYEALKLRIASAQLATVTNVVHK